ncbi:MAG: dihydropyrimidinase [Deltaproteobacteria bacterium]|nr:dihydropyrimidinase [Deltaproteobacteria bacterium]
MGLLIKGGKLITADSSCFADIYCADQQISLIGRDLSVPPGTREIDATGKLVFPGFVDPHTHVFLPVGEQRACDDYRSASRAALLGGTTCFIDFVSPTKHEEPLASLERWNNESNANSACDFSYHMTVSRCDAQAISQLREIVADGITSFKVYLAYPGLYGLDDAELYAALSLAKQLGVITACHCENETLLQQLQQRLIGEGKVEPKWHYHSRPPALEALGTCQLLTFAELTGAHAYVVHCSCKEALDQARIARARGVKCWVETVIQHYLLDRSYAERGGFQGAKYVMSPPLRDAPNQAELWRALDYREVDTVATDHAPFSFATHKALGREDFTKILNGLPGIQERIQLLYTYGVREGRIDLHRMVDAASTRPARLFGLYPQKGTIQIGADADLVVFDAEYRSTLSATSQASAADYCAYEGWTVYGRAESVTVRGQLVVEDGEFVGRFGHGRLVRREPNHFD